METEDKMQHLLQIVHDDMDDCKLFHVADASTEEFIKGTQSYLGVLKQSCGDRAATAHMLAAATTVLAGSMLTLLQAMVDHPVDGDIPDEAERLKYVIEATMMDFHRIVAEMSENTVLISFENTSMNIFASGSKH
jgi:hypothetical protein